MLLSYLGERSLFDFHVYFPGASSGRSKHDRTRKGLAVGLGISCACLFIIFCVLRPKILKKWHEGNFRIACNRTDILRASNTAKPAMLVNEGIRINSSNAANTATDSRDQDNTSSSNATVTASEGKTFATFITLVGKNILCIYRCIYPI